MSYKLLPNIAGVRVATGNGEESSFTLESAETELKFVSDGSIFLGTDPDSKTIFMAVGSIGGPTVKTMTLPYSHTAFALGDETSIVRRTQLADLMIPPNSVILGISVVVSQPLAYESGTPLDHMTNLWFEFSGEPYSSPYPFIAIPTGAAATDGPNEVPMFNPEGGWYERHGIASAFVGGLWSGGVPNLPTIAVKGVSNNYGGGGSGDYVNMDFTDWTSLEDAGFTNDGTNPWTHETGTYLSPPASAGTSPVMPSFTTTRLKWSGQVANYATLSFNFKISDPGFYQYSMLEIYVDGMYLGGYWGNQEWQPIEFHYMIPPSQPGFNTEIEFVYTNGYGEGEQCFLDDIRLFEADGGYTRQESIVAGQAEVSVWYEEDAEAGRNRRDMTDEEKLELEQRKAALANAMYAAGTPGDVISAELERMSLEDLRRIEEARMGEMSLTSETEKIISANSGEVIK